MGNNIKIEGKLYELGEEWKILTLKDSGKIEDYSDEAWEIYYNILKHALAILREDGYPISSESNKHNNII